ncbi:MAG: hypothetical protein JWQ88_3309 [Rhodoferax sp.]|nr:hypothetical protein [Rhodoferax sp.]
MPLLPPPTTEEFTRALGHEMRNLMGCVVVSAEVLRMGIGGDAMRRNALDILDRQAVRLESVMGTALDMARMLDQRELASGQRPHLNGVVSGLLARALAEERVVLIAEEPVFVSGDPVRLRDALGVLLNAVMIASPAEPVRAWLGIWGDHAVLRVAPAAAEFPAQGAPDALQAFDRAQGMPGENMPEGLGLEGLATRRILALHGAGLQWLRLEAGRGFELRLPVLAEPQRAASSV